MGCVEDFLTVEHAMKVHYPKRPDREDEAAHEKNEPRLAVP